MSFFRELFYALAVGRMAGNMIRERRSREWQRRKNYARSILPSSDQRPPFAPQAPPDKKVR